MIQGSYYSNGKMESVLQEDRIRACLQDAQGVLWMDFHNATAAEWMLLDEIFHFHPLAIGDSMTVQHDPKINVFDDYLFMVSYALNSKGKKYSVSELDIFLGPNYVVTIHKGEIPCLQKARAMGKKIFESGSAFLMHSILDTLVGDYMPFVEKMNEQIDLVEQTMASKTTNDLLRELYGIKREIIHVRRILGPIRDTIFRLTRDDLPMVPPKVRLYFRDTFEQLFRISMLLDTYKDLATSAQELHLYLVTNKNNEIIKTLTIITTIILPLTLVTGLYGMNFVHMPELQWKYGYYMAILVMVLMVLGSLYYLKRRKWF